MKTLPLGREPEQITIYLDIETIPAGEPVDPNTLEPPGNLKKADTIEQWKIFEAPKVAQELYRKRSLNSMDGQVLCIGFAINDGPLVVILEGPGHESETLELFEKELLIRIPSSYAAFTWVAHNGIGFDFKWIKRKAIQYGLPWLAQSIKTERYGSNVVDTMQLWQMGDYREPYTKLSKIAEFLGIPDNTNGVDGSMIYDMYLAGRIDEICEYCRNDVDQVRAVYKKIMFLED